MRSFALALFLSAAAAEDKIPSAAAAPGVPVDSLTGAHHHALELAITGFYAVFLPKDFDLSGKKKYPLCIILHGSGSTEVSHGVGLAADVGLDGIIYIAPRAPNPEHEVFMEHKEPGWDAWPTFPPEWGRWGEPTFPKAELVGLDAIDQYTDWIGRCVRDARKRYPVAECRGLARIEAGARLQNPIGMTRSQL